MIVLWFVVCKPLFHDDPGALVLFFPLLWRCQHPEFWYICSQDLVHIRIFHSFLMDSVGLEFWNIVLLRYLKDLGVLSRNICGYFILHFTFSGEILCILDLELILCGGILWLLDHELRVCLRILIILLGYELCICPLILWILVPVFGCGTCVVQTAESWQKYHCAIHIWQILSRMYLSALVL